MNKTYAQETRMQPQIEPQIQPAGSPPPTRVKFFPGKRVVVAFPPARSSARLLQEAHAAFTISRKTLQDSQLPDQVTKPDGFVLNRPPEWR